jgi:hypothetical protein|tara:strand:+ start:923 stop:1093 length:171 start_codon:yes stop_codon:yes gene_type:complete
MIKKNLPRCIDCGEDNSILTQISSGPEIVLLCGDCYNQKYLNEIQNEINHIKKQKK